VVLAGARRLRAHEIVVAHVDEQEHRRALGVALDGERRVRVAAAGVDAVDAVPIFEQPVEAERALLRRTAGQIGRARRQRRGERGHHDDEFRGAHASARL
jgi:hypothetical protein